MFGSNINGGTDNISYQQHFEETLARLKKQNQTPSVLPRSVQYRGNTWQVLRVSFGNYMLVNTENLFGQSFGHTQMAYGDIRNQLASIDTNEMMDTDQE